MSVTPPERCIALINRADFLRAKELVENFDQWEAFEDYLDDREGLWMGLAFAGSSIRLAAVSLDPFLAWCRATGEPATVESLNEFAGLREAVRRERNVQVPLLLERQEQDEDRRASFLTVAVNSRAYEAWLVCLQERSSPALLEAYARFIVEAWSEFLVPEISLE